MLIAVPDSLDAGRFIVADRIGAGGMAIVHLAWDRARDEWCAAKFLAPEFLRKRKIRARFGTEASTMGQLDHAHVLRLIHADVDCEAPYLVMELAACGSIEDWLANNGALPPRMAAEVALQAARGLAEAHQRNIVHRDVKPDNLLIARDGTIKVTDFGIARELDLDSFTRTGSVMGTYAYMSPEQKNNAKAVDVRSDVYALASTTIAMIEGQANHDVMALVHDPSLREHIPGPLWNVLEKALQYRPEDRYADAAEMADALEAILPGLPTPDDGTPSLDHAPMELGDPPEVADPTTETGVGYDVYAAEARRREGVVPATPRVPQAAEPAPPPKQPKPEPRRSGMGLFAVLAVGLVVLVGLGGAGVFGAAWVGSEPVTAAHDAWAASISDLETAVHQQSSIVSDLEELGANWQGPMAHLDAVGEAEGEDRLRHAQVFVTSCERELGRVERTDANSAVYDAAQGKVAALTDSKQDVSDSYDAWFEASSTRIGQLAITLGLATGPD